MGQSAAETVHAAAAESAGEMAAAIPASGDLVVQIQRGLSNIAYTDITVDGGSVKPDIDGGFVGGHVAGLWQFDQAVIGAEADLNYASIDGTTEAAPGNIFGTDVKWFGSINAKAGYAMDRVLIYGIGGVAFAGIETSQAAGTTFARTRTSTGWTLGAGVDYALTNNVVVGAQYRYYDFGKEHFDASDTFTERDQDVKLQTLGVNFSYKF